MTTTPEPDVTEPTRFSRPVAVLVLVLGFGLALLAGFAMGAIRESGATDPSPASTAAPVRTPPTVGDPIPVVEPTAFAVEPIEPADAVGRSPVDPATAAGPPSGTPIPTPGSGASGAVTPVSAPELPGSVAVDDSDSPFSAGTPDAVAAATSALSQTGGEAVPEATADAPNPGGGDASVTEPPATEAAVVDTDPVTDPVPLVIIDTGPTQLTDPLLRFEDVCAKDAGEGCPEGVTGTILAEEWAVPPQPMHIVGESYMADHPLTADCAGSRRNFPGQGVFELVTNNPGTFVLSGGIEATMTTPADATQRWFDEPEARTPITTCIAVSNPPHTLVVHVIATDVEESTEVRDFTLETETPDARPPGTIDPVGLAELRITLPVRNNEQTALLVRPADPTGALNPCRTNDAVHAVADAQRLPYGVGGLWPGYDPAYDHLSVMTLRPPSGAAFDVCVLAMRTESEGVTFVSYARSYHVTPPALYGVDAEIVALKSTRGDAPSGPFRAEVKRVPGAPACQLDRDAHDLPATSSGPTGGASWGGISLCSVPAGETTGYVQIATTFGGQRREVAVAVPSRVCVRVGSTYCPTVSLDRFVEAPVSDDLTLDVHLHLVATEGLRSEWTIAPARERLDQAGTAFEPAAASETPYLDLAHTTVTAPSGTAGESQLVVLWNTDRPGFVNAWVESYDHATCSRDPAAHDSRSGTGSRRTSTDAPSDQGIAVLDGLCAGTRYQIAITVQDVSGGHVSSYSDALVSPRPTGAARSATTSSVDVRYRAYYRPTVIPPEWEGKYLRVDGYAFAIGGDPPLGQDRTTLRNPTLGRGTTNWAEALCGPISTYHDWFLANGKWSEDIDVSGGVQAYVSSTPCNDPLTQDELDHAPSSDFFWDEHLHGHGTVPVLDADGDVSSEPTTPITLRGAGGRVELQIEIRAARAGHGAP